jgi:hypothetical protein
VQPRDACIQERLSSAMIDSMRSGSMSPWRHLSIVSHDLSIGPFCCGVYGARCVLEIVTIAGYETGSDVRPSESRDGAVSDVKLYKLHYKVVWKPVDRLIVRRACGRMRSCLQIGRRISALGL